MIPNWQRRAEREQTARNRAASGVAAADYDADLVDLIDLARHGRLVDGGAHRVWERAAGFADDGPEVA